MWEVDVYEDENAGLVTVDVELLTSRADHPIVPSPDWVIPEEITRVDRYKNIHLTKHPIGYGNENSALREDACFFLFP